MWQVSWRATNRHGIDGLNAGGVTFVLRHLREHSVRLRAGGQPSCAGGEPPGAGPPVHVSWSGLHWPTVPDRNRDGFRITPYGEPGQHRFLCRPILETYRKVFRYADVAGATALSVRYTVVARLYERGADDEKVGRVLVISDRSAVRELFPRSRPTMASLAEELV